MADSRARCVVATLSTVLVCAAIAVPARASGAAGQPEQIPGALTLTSSALEVQVASDFPQVISYRHGQGGTLDGRAEPLDSMVLNGTEYPVEADADQVDSTEVGYDLTFPDHDGVTMGASITLEGNVTTFAIDAVTDTEAFRVGTIDIPGHDLLSVSSDQPGATVATAIVSANRNTSGDSITRVTTDTPADPQPKGSAYAIVSTELLAAAVETNSTYDQSSGPAANEQGRIWRQARKDGDATTVGLWSGQWTYRADGAAFTEDLPWAKVVVTPEANGDDTVDWQDGAVALREIANQPPGWEKTADRVAAHIPFNFASQATHPFLRTLDDVKRVSLATDGLGQLAVLKGYGSEGHDSAHPDYGGNYNTRAGGLADLNTLLAEGEKWGADFGVHVNATESYPEATAFSEELVDKDARGWNWIDQSYYNDMRHDLASGNVVDRFAQLREETHPNLEFLYIDVYYQYGWLQERLARQLHEQGWQIGTEWSYHFEESALWSHWANDESYGGSTNKGLNSQIIRFVRNHQKDIWNPHPILGNPEIREFEGWTGETDWNWFYDNIWQRNLPAKFLQHHQILDWDDDEIRFTDDVRGVNTGDGTDTREIFVGEAKVLDGDTYLLPWKTNRGPEKLYHYNTEGGTTTWDLTDKWSKTRRLALYELTDQGRDLVANVPVRAGAVTVEAEARTAYVLDHRPGSDQPRGPKPDWGQGTHLADPGFHAGNLDAWDTTGDTGVEPSGKGHLEAVLRAGEPASIGQRLTGLQPGRHALGAWIEVEPGQTRRTTVSVDSGGTTSSEYVDRSTARNQVAADEKHGSYFQRVEVVFDVPDGSDSATVTITAEAGDPEVRVDDLRVVAIDRHKPGELPDGVLVSEDFEEVVQGWSPFVKGDAGGVTDPRTHLAERNAPYTQAGWNGKLVDDVLDGEWSLKSHGENAGLVYRTVPQTVPFEPGHRYRVSFDHQVAVSGHYQWVTGYDSVRGGEPRSVEVDATPLGEQRSTERFSSEFVAGSCGDYWVGARKTGGGGAEADLIVDDFTVEDLGVADGQPACGTLEITADAEKLEPGQANTVTTTFTSDEQEVASDLEMTLGVPSGWQVEATSPTTFAAVTPGQSVETTWAVTPPVDAEPVTHELTAIATYTVAGEPRTISDTLPIETIPPPPTADVFASDLGWVSASNGWGPVEIDTANGESGAGDGPPITLNGVVYDKGLGAHAVSRVRYFLGGNCETFVADVGLDDAQPSRGTVTFQVLADGVTVAESPVMRPDTATHRIEADIDGARYVDLLVGDAGDGVGNDHGDWADAQFLCSGDGTGGGGEEGDPLLPSSELTVTDVSSEDVGTDGGRGNAVDDDVTSLWHSAWSEVDPDAPYPHRITVDTGQARQLSGVVYTPRQTGTNGMIKGYEVYVGADGTSWGEPVATGEFPDSRTPQRVDFPATAGRFVKLVATSSINGATFAAVAELDVVAAPAP